MDWVFSVLDPEGVPVLLSWETWLRKAGNGEPGEHPEIKEYLAEIQEAVVSPDLVFQSAWEPRSRLFYRLNVGRGRFEGKHLVVVVKYVTESGRVDGQEMLQAYVSTVYLARSVYTRGALLWHKNRLSDA